MTTQDWASAATDSTRRQQWSARVAEVNRDLNALLSFDAESRVPAAATGSGPLAGVPFAVKDNIAVDGLPLTCGSRLLTDLVSPYSATAVTRLEQAGAWVAGKANLDEFGMGSSGQHSAFGPVRNPWDITAVPGGSSSGSAAAVAAGMVPLALGSDTGGSVRQPASFCGVYGLKPTYGAVSRFGLVAYASSLDVVGVIAETAALARTAFAAMRGADRWDQSSVDAGSAPPPGGMPTTVGVPRGALAGLHPRVAEVLAIAEARLEENGCTVVDVELPALEHVAAAYYVIATAEASANLARYDGIRYGVRGGDGGAPGEDVDKLVRATRSAGFGREVKTRILTGTFVLRSGFQEQYYQRAQRVRTLVREEVDRALAGCDLMLLPTYPVPPFTAGGSGGNGDDGLDELQQKQADLFTSIANLSGHPALAFPVDANDGRPIGMQLMGPAHSEERLFAAAERLAERWPPERATTHVGDIGAATAGAAVGAA